MALRAALFLLTFKYTAGYHDGFDWKLAINIHASDGHNFGFGAPAWDEKIDLGSDSTAFSADYKSYNVTLKPANYIAIVRHQDGACEAARVWKFLTDGKTLYQYLDIEQNSRLVATEGNWTSSYISPTMIDQQKDPIFAVDGALVFNWWASNDGVRIGNSKTYCSGSGLASKKTNANSYFGLGNDISGHTHKGKGSAPWWSDVGVQDCSKEYKYRVQGRDHGSSHGDGTLYGQYAVYVSDVAKTFPCEGITLQTSMYDKVTIDDWSPDFDRINKHDDHRLDYGEYEFDVADNDKDGVLTIREYFDARANNLFKETVHGDVSLDFYRIDRNGDRLLNFYEIEFDKADANKDGELSSNEYYTARSENLLGETD